ncbi:uncharacterized protein LOC121387477 isoform X1 [Gigantopelta aegis]|uniref:uncharacterized protein LOC121387477 isoform X1 n=1 Tax=Gigantopelta aegis TaxID=1735272 RepID=UPI001B889323|nr:uncharacterized protein LOC121387477 isoform X1 [Gigantopelta aegis]
MPRPRKRIHDDTLQKHASASGSKSAKMSDSNDTYDFTKAKSYTDLVLRVDGQCLHVSRSVLMMASPVFEKMFESDFCEKSKDIIDLPHKNFDDVHSLLQLLVPGCNRTKLTYDVALKVYPLAHEYQMDDVKSSCVDVLVTAMDKRQVRVTDLCDWFGFAGTYGLPSLEDACTRRLTELDGPEMREFASADSDVVVPWRTCQALLKKLADVKERGAQHEEVQNILKCFFVEHAEHCKARHMSSATCCRWKCDPVSNWTQSGISMSPHCWQHIVHKLVQCNKFIDWLGTF